MMVVHADSPLNLLPDDRNFQRGLSYSCRGDPGSGTSLAKYRTIGCRLLQRAVGRRSRAFEFFGQCCPGRNDRTCFPLTRVNPLQSSVKIDIRLIDRLDLSRIQVIIFCT